VQLCPKYRDPHYNRNLQRNLATLQAFQTARLARRETEMKEARKLLQLNEMKHLPYNPKQDGFVFSNDQIHAAIDRERRLDRAGQTDFTRHKPQKIQTRAA